MDDIPYNFIKKPSLSDKFNFIRRAYHKDLNYFDFGQFLTSSVDEMLDNWFESDILKASLATKWVRFGALSCLSGHICNDL